VAGVHAATGGGPGRLDTEQLRVVVGHVVAGAALLAEPQHVGTSPGCRQHQALDQGDRQGRDRDVLPLAEVGPEDDPAEQVVVRAEGTEEAPHILYGLPTAGCVWCLR
jgi:hypothetical protein